MKLLLLATLLLLAACSLTVNDSPQLRDAMQTKTALTVIAVPPLPGRIRIWRVPPPTPLPDWTYTVTPEPNP